MAPANVLVEKNVTVPMRDGVETYGDLYRPADGAPAPGIVSRTPYDKEGYGGLRSMPLPLKLAEAGYAVLVTDTRGRFSSQGEFHPFVDEGADGYDTVEWLAAQDFCDGNVGIFGASYFGATTMLATRARPPSLRCAVSIITASDYYDDWTHYGGAFQLGFSASRSSCRASRTASRRGTSCASRCRVRTSRASTPTRTRASRAGAR